MTTPTDDLLLGALEQLRTELLEDIQLATTRVQHIRLVQRIARLDSALELARGAAAGAARGAGETV